MANSPNNKKERYMESIVLAIAGFIMVTFIIFYLIIEISGCSLWDTKTSIIILPISIVVGLLIAVPPTITRINNIKQGKSYVKPDWPVANDNYDNEPEEDYGEMGFKYIEYDQNIGLMDITFENTFHRPFVEYDKKGPAAHIYRRGNRYAKKRAATPLELEEARRYIREHSMPLTDWEKEELRQLAEISVKMEVTERGVQFSHPIMFWRR